MTETTETQGPKVVQLPEQKDSSKAAREYLKRNMDDMLEAQRVLAKIRRALFLALVEEGFTEEQALTLCVK